MKELKMVSKSVCVIVLILVLFSTCGFFNNKGRFVRINLEPQDHNQPVKLNDNEVFFPGGSYNFEKKGYDTAKIYNIEKQEMKDTHATMNVPRSSYGAIKYDDNHILVVGGSCSNLKSTNLMECSKVAEVYDIKKNKFTRIMDTKLSYLFEIHTILLHNNCVFIYSKGLFEIFKPQNNTFSLIVKPKMHEFKYTSGEKYVLPLCTNYRYLQSSVKLLNEKEILIEGISSRPTTYLVEILNMNTGNVRKIEDTKGLPIHEPIRFKDGSLLYIGAGKDRKKVEFYDAVRGQYINMPDSPKALAGQNLLLDNGTILVTYGTIDSGNLFKRSVILLHAIYDYKKNKVYHWKTTSNDYYSPYLIPLRNAVLIVGYKTNFASSETMLYKY